jgi:hypothetical protein
VAVSARHHLLASLFISGHLPNHLAFIGSGDVLAMGYVCRAGGQAEHPVRLDLPVQKLYMKTGAFILLSISARLPLDARELHHSSIILEIIR